MPIALIADGADTTGIYPLRLVGLCFKSRRLFVKNTHRYIRRITIALIADGDTTGTYPLRLVGLCVNLRRLLMKNTRWYLRRFVSLLMPR